MQKSIKVESGKFVGYVNGKAVVRSSSKYYVERKLEAFVEDEPSNESTAFDINTRFQFVEDLVGMVATKATASALVTGEGGLGKTYTVIKALEAAGLRNIDTLAAGVVVNPSKTYKVIKGFSTAKGLFRILAENADSILVFDDCDSILKDDNALNILKGALDTFDRRIITWNTSRDEDDIPRSFEFKGGIVFISNMPLARIEQAVRTRAMVVDLSMTTTQKIERMALIMKSDEFMPEVKNDVKAKAFELVAEMKEKCAEVSLRTLIKATKIAASGNPNWKKLAEYMLVQG